LSISKKLYKKGKFYTRTKLGSYKNKQSKHIINVNKLSVPLNYQDINGKYLIYRTLFINNNNGFEIFCREKSYFCYHDNGILNKYVKQVTGYEHLTDFNPNVEITSDFNWIIQVCANAQFYNKMKNHEFIDIWNQLNTIVRYNILK